MDQQIHIPIKSAEPVQPESPKPNRLPKTFGILAVLAVVLALAVFAYRNYRPSQKQGGANNQINNTPSVVSGSFKLLTDDLKLFRETQIDKENNFKPIYHYYEAGTYVSGPYAGYKRIIGTEFVEGPEGGYIALFATKDNKSYVLDKASSDQYVVEEWVARDKYSPLDPAKVVGAENLPTDHPDFYPITGNDFVVVRAGIHVESGYDTPDPLTTQLNGNKKLDSKDANLSVYESDPAMTDEDYKSLTQGADSQRINFVDTQRRYLHTDNTLYMADKTGLIYDYQIIPKAAWDRAGKEAKADLFDGVYADAFNLKSGDFVASNSLYTSYGMFLPSGCAIAPLYILQNINDSELSEIAKLNTQSFFTFKDSNHALNQAAYYDKISSLSNELFLESNNTDQPSYKDYVAKAPILITKDPWGRYLGFGETQYILPGGCGGGPNH